LTPAESGDPDRRPGPRTTISRRLRWSRLRTVRFTGAPTRCARDSLCADHILFRAILAMAIVGPWGARPG